MLVLTMVTVLYGASLQLIHLAQVKHCAHPLAMLHFLFPQTLATTTPLVESVDLIIVDSLCKWRHTVFALL